MPSLRSKTKTKIIRRIKANFDTKLFDSAKLLNVENEL